jgi:hypothetical protein
MRVLCVRASTRIGHRRNPTENRKFNHSFPMFNLHFPTISFSEEFSAFLEALDYIGRVVGLVIEKTRCEHRGSRRVSYVGLGAW